MDWAANMKAAMEPVTYKTESSTDLVVVKCYDATTIKVAPDILEKSEFFRKAFADGWKESDTRTIDFSAHRGQAIPGNRLATSSNLKAYVEWLHEGKNPHYPGANYGTRPVRDKAVYEKGMAWFQGLEEFADYVCDAAFAEKAAAAHRFFDRTFEPA